MYKYIDRVNSTKSKLIAKLIKHGYQIHDGHCNWIHIRKNEQIELPKNIVFRTECTIPGDYNSDWIRLQISSNINDYQLSNDYFKEDVHINNKKNTIFTLNTSTSNITSIQSLSTFFSVHCLN